jgi:NAD(P)-dependent dehydrogenase (short-subunit alcohol dehydrogenase family)
MRWFEDIDEKEFSKTMDVNFTSFIIAVKELLPSISNAKGLIFSVVSSAANIPMRTSVSYNTSKAALQMAIKQMGRELTSRHDVCVIGLNPSIISDTNMTKKNCENIKTIRNWSDLEVCDAMASSSPSGELLSKSQVVDFTHHILETFNRNISGTVFDLGTF